MINSLGYRIPDKSSKLPRLHPFLDYERMLFYTGWYPVPHVRAKTIHNLVRYKNGRLAGIVSEKNVPTNAPIPVFRSFEETLVINPDVLVIGAISIDSYEMPERHLTAIRKSIEHKIDILNLHHFSIESMFSGQGVRVQDMRDPQFFHYATGESAKLKQPYRVLTVGVDVSVGKMITAMELRNAAVKVGMNAVFIPTGQTGMMIEEWGMCIDHLMSDYIAGGMEALILQATSYDIAFIEGQSCILHPYWAGLAADQIIGASPNAMIMVYRDNPFYIHDLRINSLQEQIQVCELMTKCQLPAKVIAVSLNGADKTKEEIENMRDYVTETTGLPCADPIHEGPEPLLRIVREHAQL